MLKPSEKQEPQGLKPLSSAADSGMAKAMPSHSDGDGNDGVSVFSATGWMAQITL